jgi:hypothetical protein
VRIIGERISFLNARLLLLAMVLLVAGCSRIDTLRLAHANGGTPVDWPAGVNALEFDLQLSSDGRPWLPISVDGSAPVPFLLQASAGAIAITGARAAGFGPAGAGRLSLREHLLPGVAGGLLIKQRRLAIGELVLGDQSVLLVDPANWPHGMPRQGPAGVLGYDLNRRFIIEFDLGGRRLSLYRAGGLDVGAMAETQRLAILGRVPYFEAWLEPARGQGRWVRLQFEPGEPGGICLDAGPTAGTVLVAGHQFPLEDAPCRPAASSGHRAERDGVFGAGALRDLVVAVDYAGGRIGFRSRD